MLNDEKNKHLKLNKAGKTIILKIVLAIFFWWLMILIVDARCKYLELKEKHLEKKKVVVCKKILNY